MIRNPARLAALLASALLAGACDGGNRTTVEPTADQAARRIVTLAPHLAELIFDLDAGDRLVGVSAYTDYPEAVRALPVISDAFVVDREQLALLEPDLLLAWDSGTPVHVVEQLRQAGFRVEVIATQGLDDVATALLRIGELTGREDIARQVAERYRGELAALERVNADSEPIRVFYQISRRPLYTVNGNHYISELVELCGGVNVFHDIGDLAPLVDVEAVINRDPEVLMAGRDSTSDPFVAWDRWPGIAANRYGNRFFLPADEVGRATTRLVQAAEHTCLALQTARQNRRASQRSPGLP